jgi:hypothetical protein
MPLFPSAVKFQELVLLMEKFVQEWRNILVALDTKRTLAQGQVNTVALVTVVMVLLAMSVKSVAEPGLHATTPPPLSAVLFLQHMESSAPRIKFARMELPALLAVVAHTLT